MPHIALSPDLPGIRGAMAFRPETARPLNALVEILLTGPNTLSRGERELIATYVSSRNCTHYCHSIHGAIAAAHFGGDEALVKQVKTDFTQAPIGPKLFATLLSVMRKLSGRMTTRHSPSLVDTIAPHWRMTNKPKGRPKATPGLLEWA